MESHNEFKVPVLGFAAYYGTGKTTLLVKLLPLMKLQGLRVAMIKQTHHDFEIDKPGKDSYELRMAGADQMLIASKYRWALITENSNNDEEVSLNDLLKNLNQNQLDLILVEGFKFENFPKIELFRDGNNRTPLAAYEADNIAIATDPLCDIDDKIPQLDLNDPEIILKFIIQHFNLSLN